VGLTLLGGGLRGQMTNRWGCVAGSQRAGGAVGGCPPILAPGTCRSHKLCPRTPRRCCNARLRNSGNMRTERPARSCPHSYCWGLRVRLRAYTEVCYSAGSTPPDNPGRESSWGPARIPKMSCGSTTFQSTRFGRPLLTRILCLEHRRDRGRTDGWSFRVRWQPYFTKYRSPAVLPSMGDERASDPALISDGIITSYHQF